MKLKLINLPIDEYENEITFAIPCSLCNFYNTKNDKAICNFREMDISPISKIIREEFSQKYKDGGISSCVNFKYKPRARKKL